MNRTQTQIILVIEDDLQRLVARKLIAQHKTLNISEEWSKGGNQYIKDNLKKFNQAAEFALPFVVLTDLDAYDCPLVLLQEWLSLKPHKRLLFRIAVREVEAWLLADRTNFAKFLGVPVSRITTEPEGIPKPKEFIFELARRSKKHNIKEGIPPKGTARTGQLYNSLLAQFVLQYWSLEAALEHAPSLKKFAQRLEEFSVMLALEEQTLE
jgi:hypothetical protein